MQVNEITLLDFSRSLKQLEQTDRALQTAKMIFTEFDSEKNMRKQTKHKTKYSTTIIETRLDCQAKCLYSYDNHLIC